MSYLPSREEALRIRDFIGAKFRAYETKRMLEEKLKSNNQSASTSTSPNTSTSDVKTEEESELNERAEKIRESNDEKMSQLKIRETQMPSRIKAGPSSDATKSPTSPGKFGWETIETVYIPYFLVGDVKYVSKRIIYDKVFKNIQAFFKENVFNCVWWNFTFLTQAEANLLNEINFVHSDKAFGKEKFDITDCKVSYDDFLEVYHFLLFCYSVLILKNPHKYVCKCGFVRINNENFVPYVLRSNKKLVPLFYFEAFSNQPLNITVIELNSIEMTYLRFCCKLQQLKSEFYEIPTCKVVDLNEIIKLFPPYTVIADTWPIVDPNPFLNPSVASKIATTKADPGGSKNSHKIAQNSKYFAINSKANTTGDVDNKNVLPALVSVDGSTELLISLNNIKTIPAKAKNSSSVIQVSKLPKLLLGSNPYKNVSKMIGNLTFNSCINLQANDFTHFMLISVDEIVQKLFKNKTFSIVEAALKFIGLDFYKLNRDQLHILKQNSAESQNHKAESLFVLYDVFLEFLPQISYMVKNKQ